MKFIIFTLLLASCGPDVVNRRTKPMDGHPDEMGFGVPIETFLIAPVEIPYRLDASSLTLEFASNALKPDFDCALGEPAEFSSCPSYASYTFDKLIHGRNYHLEVRAEDGRGGRDESPLVIEFVTDRVKGEEPVMTIKQSYYAPVNLITGANQLPAPGSKEDRELIVGAPFRVLVPYEQFVTHYVSSLSLKGDINSFELIGQNGDEFPVACPKPSRKVKNGDLTYCESFPRQDRLRDSSLGQFPDNLLVLSSEADVRRSDEILTFGYFSDKENDFEDDLTYDHYCSDSSKEWRDIPNIQTNRLFSHASDIEFSWCLKRGEAGQWVWTALYTISLGADYGNGRLRGVHMIRADRNLAPNVLQRQSLALMHALIIPAPTTLSR
jgi:hypothetical protein